jgi:lipoate-protein ligase B
MEPFSWIDPCGLAGVSMTSMERELEKPAKSRLTMETARKSLMDHAARIFHVGFSPVTLETLDKCLPPFVE